MEHCWIDNFSIKQDEADKIEQIPLMGNTYSYAKFAAIVLNCDFGFTQIQTDRMTVALREVVDAYLDSTGVYSCVICYLGWPGPDTSGHR